MDDNELNEAVARKLGWKDCGIDDSHGLVRPDTSAPCYEAINDIPDYCHSLEAAWEIVDKYRIVHLSKMPEIADSPAGYRCEIPNPDKAFDYAIAFEATPAMAICNAFLKLPDLTK